MLNNFCLDQNCRCNADWRIDHFLRTKWTVDILSGFRSPSLLSVRITRRHQTVGEVCRSLSRSFFLPVAKTYRCVPRACRPLRLGIRRRRIVVSNYTHTSRRALLIIERKYVRRPVAESTCSYGGPIFLCFRGSEPNWAPALNYLIAAGKRRSWNGESGTWRLTALPSCAELCESSAYDNEARVSVIMVSASSCTFGTSDLASESEKRGRERIFFLRRRRDERPESPEDSKKLDSRSLTIDKSYNDNDVWRIRQLRDPEVPLAMRKWLAPVRFAETVPNESFLGFPRV